MNTELRQLGQTDIYISPIGLGCWQFSDGKGGAAGIWASVSKEETDGIVQAALSGGINWFDTAEIYGWGRSELAVARALKKAGKTDQEVIIATKWSPFGRTARSITRTIGRRQECLKGYSIDLYQIHSPYGFTTRKSEMNAMADLVESGKIRSVGVSNFSALQMRQAQEALLSRGLPLASNQVRFSLLDRRIESNGILDTARELGITVIAYSPLGSGLLSGKFHQDPVLLKSRQAVRRRLLGRQIESSRELVNMLEDIAKAHSVTAAQVALSWLINFHGDAVVAIPGASKIRHAQQNIGAMSLTLSKAELEQIDNLSKQFK